ncbi:MAG: hypothetical protein CMG74_03995 [Candidatus Marinimicrobia bacterium]|nr:hypothetical protein [Candidatus Neomarinimicrobiota bacterium]|tara:strand:+ start:49918 stop:51051 length:1134 start_codon:yes stop_codon:yes gene_type:complete
MKKYVGIPLVLISIVIAAILIRNKPAARADQKGKNVPYVKTMMIFPQEIKASISSQGIIMPQTELALLSEIGSKVEWISPLMETGSSFSRGDTLIVLERRDYELALITAESSVLNAEVNLQREKAESDLATKEWERVGAGAGSDLALRKPQLAQAKATFSAAKASLERAKRNLERTVFLAPFNGRVRSRNIELGSTVFPGTLLGNIYATQYFEIRLPIADQDVIFTGLEFNGQQIVSKNQLDVIINNGESEWSGKIIRAESEVDPQTRMLALIAKIDSKIEKNLLFPIVVGQYAQAIIYGINMNDVFVLPRTSVRDESVWVVSKNMKLANRLVEILRYENEFAIIGEGFENGDRLLNSRLSSLVNGIEVTFKLDSDI